MLRNGLDCPRGIEVSNKLAHAISNIILMTKPHLLDNVITLFGGDLKLPRWKTKEYSKRAAENKNSYLIEFAQLFNSLLVQTPLETKE